MARFLATFDLVSDPSTANAYPTINKAPKRIQSISSTLESVAWAALPWTRLVARSAAWLREQTQVSGELDYQTGQVDLTFPRDKLASCIVELIGRLAFTDMDAANFTGDVKTEFARQTSLHARRRNARSLPKRPARDQRVNTTATSIFGPPETWFGNRYAPLTSGDRENARYTALRSYPPAIVLTLVEAGKPYRTHAMIYKARGGPAKSYKLPGKVSSLNNLFEVLGLKSVSGRGPVTIDWQEQCFIVNNYVVVPWKRY